MTLLGDQPAVRVARAIGLRFGMPLVEQPVRQRFKEAELLFAIPPAELSEARIQTRTLRVEEIRSFDLSQVEHLVRHKSFAMDEFSSATQAVVL